MRIAHATVFGIPRADVGVADFLMKTPFRIACKMASCNCFLVYDV